MYSEIENIKYFLPKKLNLSKKIKKFKLLYKNTGIKYVHKNQNQDVIDLAYRACKKHKNINDIDCILFVTQTPRYLLPSCSCILQDKLNISKKIYTLDINMGCSGFIYGLSIAEGLISNKIANKILLVCADTYSKYLDEKDNNRFIFSDGASATLIKRSKIKKINKFDFYTDGSKHKDIIIKPNKKKLNKFHMNGASVYLFTQVNVSNFFRNYIRTSKINLKKIKKIFFHQASKVVLDGLSLKLGLKEKIYFNLESGNTTSSSIPIAISNALKRKIIKKNDKIILCGFGVGLSIATVEIKI